MNGKQNLLNDTTRTLLICIIRGPSYADLKTNVPICDSYVSAMRAMGYHTIFDNSEQKGALAGGSTDMGSLNTPQYRAIY